MHATVAAMHGLCAAVELSRPVIDLPTIEVIIRPALDVLAHAPIIWRVQNWPRGYPGDFETIEWICDGSPRLEKSDPYYWIEWYSLNSAIVQQHRNKIGYQRAQLQTVPASGRILSVGCGGARDMLELDVNYKGHHVTLVDIDPEALCLAHARASRWAASVDVIEGDALRALRSLKEPFDLVLFGGLFDYLNDRVISLLLTLSDRLVSARRGRTIFTNVSTFSPFEAWTQYVVRWPLRFRSECEVQAITTSAAIDRERLHISRDATGLSLLCEVHPPPDC
jgi:SAM-dependent methyltransferase